MGKGFEEEAESIIQFLEMVSNSVRAGIDEMVNIGALIPVEHGFCFYCDEEKSVYDVAPEFPAQPPTCDNCLYQRGVAMFSDPDKIREIVDKFRDS